MNAERTSSFDIGYETYFNSLDLGFNITYFDILIEEELKLPVEEIMSKI